MSWAGAPAVEAAMIHPQRKLIEVALPLEAINKAAAPTRHSL